MSNPELTFEQTTDPALDAIAPATEAESAVQDTPMEPEVLPPVQSDSEIATAIAEAIAATLQTDVPAELPAEDGEMPEEELPPAAPEEAAVEAPEEEAPEPAPPEAPAAPRASGRKRTASPESAPAKAVNAASEHPDIPSGAVHAGFWETLGLMLRDLRARQRQDLPDSFASLNAREKYYARITRLSGLLAPVRYVLLALMVLALMGRRYSWMLLGFLGGESGMWIAVLLTVLSAALSWRSVVRAVKDVVYLRFSFESLLLATTLLSLVDTAAQRNTATLLPFLAIGWCLVGASDLMLSRGHLRSLRSVLTAKQRTGVRVAPNGWEHTDCIGRAPAGVTDFVRRQETADSLHAGWTLYAVPLLIAAMIIGAFLAAKTEGNYLSILVTLLTVSLPVAALWCCARPYELLTRVLGRKGAVAGWFGVKRLSGKRTILIYDTDLFPKGAVTHKGVKVYGKQTPQLLVSYGASLAVLADNGLTEPFTQLLREVGGQLHRVSYFRVTEGGLSGQINGVHVAVGTHSFMQLTGAIPPSYAPNNGLFIALNGEIAGLFDIHYKARPSAAEGFQRLVREPRLTLLAATKNLSVNPAYLQDWFQIPVGEMLCPKIETRWKLSKPSKMARSRTCGFLFTTGIQVYSRMVAGARRTHRMGMGFTILSILYSVLLLVRTASAISAGTGLIAETRLLLLQFILFLLVEASARLAVR